MFKFFCISAGHPDLGDGINLTECHYYFYSARCDPERDNWFIQCSNRSLTSVVCKDLRETI